VRGSAEEEPGARAPRVVTAKRANHVLQVVDLFRFLRLAALSAAAEFFDRPELPQWSSPEVMYISVDAPSSCKPDDRSIGSIRLNSSPIVTG
jgi:hypothetical protein